jgi:hypothetical protein
MLALVGGVLGVLLGVAGSLLIEHLTEWKPVVTLGAVSVSLAISCLTGIVFGIYPARARGDDGPRARAAARIAARERWSAAASCIGGSETASLTPCRSG